MEKELEVDNLKISAKEQEALRLRIIRTAKKNLKPNGKVNTTKVAEICECSKGHVSGTWKKYLEGGIGAVKAVAMGRPKNSGRLTCEQQLETKKLIVDKCPEQLKLKGFLWDRERVCALVYRRFKVKLTVQAMGEYLKKWGFSAQRPVKRNHKQNPIEVEKWLKEEYPAIKERARKENAEIAWGDETCCQNESNYVKGYAPSGQTPTLPVGNEHFRVSMISAITNQGKLRFMLYRGGMNAERLITFMGRLIKEASRKIFLILDNLKSHHAKLVSEWLKTHKDEIEVFFLPPYSPEYNPDEYLNGNLKRELAKKGYAKTVDELESKARGTMKSFQRDTAHVASFFMAKYVSYAA
jgi:transposase